MFGAALPVGIDVAIGSAPSGRQPPMMPTRRSGRRALPKRDLQAALFHCDLMIEDDAVLVIATGDAESVDLDWIADAVIEARGHATSNGVPLVVDLYNALIGRDADRWLREFARLCDAGDPAPRVRWPKVARGGTSVRRTLTLVSRATAAGETGVVRGRPRPTAITIHPIPPAVAPRGIR
jgi:hypothetical protein